MPGKAQSNFRVGEISAGFYVVDGLPLDANPGVKVIFNFAASGALMQQIDKGAPVDVFASADQKTMDQAKEKNLLLAETRKDFVSNGLVLIVPKDSKLAIKGVKDLSESKIARIAMGNPETVPVGRYAQEVMSKAGLWEGLKPKLAKQLTTEIEAFARTMGVKTLFLLTMTAADFFPRLGYQVTQRSNVPISIAETFEFKSACPVSAVCLRKNLE